MDNQSSIIDTQSPLSRLSCRLCSPPPVLPRPSSVVRSPPSVFHLASSACPGVALTRPGVASCEAGCEAGSPVLLIPSNLIPWSPDPLSSLLSPVSCLLRAFAASWLQVNYAKQTQFPKPQNLRILLCRKNLHQYSPPPRPKKQTQFIAAKPCAKPERTQLVAAKLAAKPDPPAIRDTLHACPVREIRNMRYAIRHPTYEIRFTLHACPVGEIRHPTCDALMPYSFAWSRMRSFTFWLGRLSAP